MKETIQSHKEKERAFPAWIGISLFFIIFISINLIVPNLLLDLGILEDTNLKSSISMFYLQITMFASVLLAAKVSLWLEQKPFSSLGLSFKGHAKEFGYGILSAILIYALGFGLLLLTGAIQISGYQFSAGNLIYSWFFYLLVSFGEEIMVRGYLLGRLLQTRMNRFVALTVTAVLFAIMHLFNPSVSAVSLINIALSGILLGAPFMYTRNLAFPISLHLFWNWIQGSILGFHVSGNEIGNPLLALHIPENNLLNGGEFGFEGSIVCTILLFLFSAIFIFWGEKKRSRDGVDNNRIQITESANR